MRIGVVKEIKPAERRVALTPAGARELVTLGHDVLVEANAGAGSGCPDDAYISIGARNLGGAEQVWRDSELLLKVKEPVEAEYPLLHADLTLFTYLHLAPNRPLTQALLTSKATGIAYETVREERRSPATARTDERDRRASGRPGGRLLPAGPAGRPRAAHRRRHRGGARPA